jgi:glutathione S-transferase
MAARQRGAQHEPGDAMILVGQYDSPYTRRVAIALHWLGLPFSRNTLSVFANADQARKINPLGRVPALILDDGEVLIDSSAILDHIDEIAGPARALLPASGTARRQQLRTIALATGGMEKAVSIVYERVLRPSDKLHVPWLERCQTQLAGSLAALEVLPPSDVLTTGRHPQADIAVACLIGFLGLRVPDAFPSGKYPRLSALAANAELLPAFQATKPSDTDTPPAAFKA